MREFMSITTLDEFGLTKSEMLSQRRQGSIKDWNKSNALQIEASC